MTDERYAARADALRRARDISERTPSGVCRVLHSPFVADDRLADRPWVVTLSGFVLPVTERVEAIFVDGRRLTR